MKEKRGFGVRSRPVRFGEESELWKLVLLHVWMIASIAIASEFHESSMLWSIAGDERLDLIEVSAGSDMICQNSVDVVPIRW